jgi:hypothetical protein
MKCNRRAIYKKGRCKCEVTSNKNMMRQFNTNCFMLCLKQLDKFIYRSYIDVTKRYAFSGLNISTVSLREPVIYCHRFVLALGKWRFSDPDVVHLNEHIHTRLA